MINRQIKYQAWHKQKKKMYSVLSLYLQEHGGVEVFEKWTTDFLTGEKEMETRFYSFDDIELREYTGLKDSKGTDIYEGDIVRIDHPHDLTGDFTNAIGGVFWWNEEGGWYHGNGNGRPPKRMWKYVEVIGNIYEHSELLNRSNNDERN